MSFLFNFQLEAYFESRSRSQHCVKNRWAKLAVYIHRRMDKITTYLNDRELVFEAGESEELSESFKKFVAQEGSPEDFGFLWEAFEVWADQGVSVSGGREKTLAKITHLPATYSQ